MKLGEIKLEALRIMNVGNPSEYDIENIESLEENTDYGELLLNMPGSINRCFSDLEARGVLPTKVITLNAESGEISHGRIRFDLSELIADFYDVERVIFASDSEYIGNFAYQREGYEIVIDYEEGAEYRVAYRPKLARVFGYTENDTEIELPDDIAALVPYFIKGDLYREDETGEASEARNWYEAGISARRPRDEGITGSVRSLYSFEEV